MEVGGALAVLLLDHHSTHSLVCFITIILVSLLIEALLLTEHSQMQCMHACTSLILSMTPLLYLLFPPSLHS